MRRKEHTRMPGVDSRVPRCTKYKPPMVEVLARYPALNVDALVSFVIDIIQEVLVYEEKTSSDPVLQNKVCTVPLGTGELDTSAIEAGSINHKYKKREFPAHTSRFRKWTVLAFKKSKLVINNVRTEEQMYFAIRESY